VHSYMHAQGCGTLMHAQGCGTHMCGHGARGRTRALNQGREYWYMGSTLARSEMAKYSRLARNATGRYLSCTTGTHGEVREGGLSLSKQHPTNTVLLI
jgi:hypothetical protein